MTWAFEFEDQAYFAGFRVMASNGIDLPVFNVFRMLSRMGAERVPAVSDGAVDLDAMMKAGVREQARRRRAGQPRRAARSPCSPGTTTTTTSPGPTPT